MYILAIDTSTSSGGAALSHNRETVGMVMVKQPLRYSEIILELVDFLLKQHHKRLQEVDCLAVSTGPGSFTGVRIGLATVKGLCQGLNKPAAGISTLESLAYRFRAVHPVIAPMIDARRQQVYGAVFRFDQGATQRLSPEQVLKPSTWLDSIPVEECLFVGDGAALHRKTILEAHPQARILDTDNQILEPLCQLAHARVEQAQTVAASELRANYIRPPDIRR